MFGTLATRSKSAVQKIARVRPSLSPDSLLLELGHLGNRTRRRTMATATHIELTPATAGVYHAPDISTQSAQIGSQLLQENHEKWHMYFNRDGFHNHIAHHLLTLYALGATPEEIQRGYDHNKSYQRPQLPVNEKNVEDMADRNKFKKFLGKEKYFHDYEVFFRKEIEQKGWEAVLTEQLFARDEHAETMLTRMYAGKQKRCHGLKMFG